MNVPELKTEKRKKKAQRHVKQSFLENGTRNCGHETCALQQPQNEAAILRFLS